MTLLGIESALLAQVQAAVTPLGLNAETFPDQPGQYVLANPAGVVLVIYRGSSYSLPKAADAMAQVRDMHFELAVLARDLHSAQGAYPALDALRGALAGWMAPGAIQGARLDQEGFLDRDGSLDGNHLQGRDGFLGGDGFLNQPAGTVWQWVLRLSIPALSVPADPVDPTNPSYGLLQQTDFYPEAP
jgi:hypothetical protein